jgi:uncharacterized protein YodC (DUF2158 family)
VDFELLTDISNIEVIAEGSGVRVTHVLRRMYGGRHWRKLKGSATVRLRDGRIREAEIHWYEAHGVGRKRFKIKRLVPETW